MGFTRNQFLRTVLAGIRSFRSTSWRLLLLLTVVFVSACGGSSGGDVSQPEPQSNGTATGPVGEVVPPEDMRVIATAEAKPYRPDSDYASVMLDCMYVPDVESLFPFSTLPYIGQNNDFVSVDDVMQRVLVTHDWMGVRLEEMLYRMPPDLVQLFAPVTVIIIGSEVRPSSFTPALGLMQLDPYDLWLNNDERQTISVTDDFRTDFGSGLRFVGLSRVMMGDNYTSYFWPEGEEREHDLLEIPLARLLYHELGHANDYVQRDNLALLGDDLNPYLAIEQLSATRVSALLPADLSLSKPDAFFDGLAGVRYRDEQPTAAHTIAQADGVGARMDAGGKIKFYSYSSPQEDVATLLETAMMKFHYDVDTHVAFANKPADEENAECNDYVVAWGVRNRLASPLVTPRANFVVDKIMEQSADIDDFFANHIGESVPLRQGEGWCDSRFFAPSFSFGPQARDLSWTMQPDFR